VALREVFARFTTRFDGSALRQGSAQVSGLTTSLRGAASGFMALGAVVAAMAIVRVISGWVEAVRDFVNEMAGVGDELDKTSRTLGIGVGVLQEWRHAAGLSGVEAGALNSSLRRLAANMNLAAITPTSAAAIEFDRLGISLTGADGQLRDMSDVLVDMADPISQMGSSTQRVATLTALLGRQGAALGPMFEGGRAGVMAMRAELERLGGGATAEMVQASADLVDAQARLDLAFLSIKSRIATSLLPIYQGLVDALTSVTAWLARHEQAAALLKIGLIGIAVVVGIVALAIAAILGPVLLGLLVIMSPLILVIVGLILVFQDLYVWVTGGNSVIGTFVESMLALAGISLQDVRDEWRSLVDTIREAYNAVAVPLGLDPIQDSHRGPSAKAANPSTVEPRAAGAGTAAPETTFLGRIRAHTAATLADRTGAGPALPSVTDARRAARPNQTIRQDTRFQITGNDPAAIGETVRRIMDSQTRDAVEALGQ